MLYVNGLIEVTGSFFVLRVLKLGERLLFGSLSLLSFFGPPTLSFLGAVGGSRSQGNLLSPQTFSSMLSIKILYANESL